MSEPFEVIGVQLDACFAYRGDIADGELKNS